MQKDIYKYHYKNKKELTNEEKDEINELILSEFKSSRIDFYENMVYIKNNDKIIGFAGLYFIDKFLSINQLIIDKNHRNKKLGSKILNVIFDLYKYINIILYIDKNKENTDFLFNFYSKHGFKEIDYLNTFNLTYYPDIEYLMIKEG